MKASPTLYHLSDINHNGETFNPRIPQSYYRDEYDQPLEDVSTNRICFSSHLNGAYLACEMDGDAREMYVHIPDCTVSPDNIIQPTKKQCIDAKFTYERWVVNQPVKMKCIGKARFSCDLKNHNVRESWRPEVKIKWIEKY